MEIAKVPNEPIYAEGASVERGIGSAGVRACSGLWGGMAKEAPGGGEDGVPLQGGRLFGRGSWGDAPSSLCPRLRWVWAFGPRVRRPSQVQNTL